MLMQTGDLIKNQIKEGIYICISGKTDKKEIG